MNSLLNILVGLSISLPLMASAQSANLKVNAICDMTAHENEFRDTPYAKLLVTDYGVFLFFFENRNDAIGMDGVNEDVRSIYSFNLEETNGRHRSYSNPSLENTKKTEGSNTVFTIKNGIVTKTSEYKAQLKPFTLKVERRDYDYDYTGWFFRLHGYVVKGKAEYSCQLL